MDFVRRTIIDHETVITKELLDSFQDGIIEAITKAEAALDTPSSVYNAATRDEFPPVGDPEIIYKAFEEKTIYQWNNNELKYEPLKTGSSVEDLDGTIVNGGSADGLNDSPGDSGENVVINGGDASGIGK